MLKHGGVTFSSRVQCCSRVHASYRCRYMVRDDEKLSVLPLYFPPRDARVAERWETLQPWLLRGEGREDASNFTRGDQLSAVSLEVRNILPDASGLLLPVVQSSRPGHTRRST